MNHNFFATAYRCITYFLAPPFCLFCSSFLLHRQALCSSCSLQILPIVPLDLYTGKDQLIKVFAFSAYKDPIRALILSKHTRNQSYIHALTDFVVQQSDIAQLDFDYIAFIPLHWSRYAARGFNQAEMLAQAIAKKSGKRVVPLLLRRKKTQFQARLSPDQRNQNVHGAFAVQEQYVDSIANKKILLVDDLFTTGSTIKAATSVLWKYNPSKIDVFVIARVV